MNKSTKSNYCHYSQS